MSLKCANDELMVFVDSNTTMREYFKNAEGGYADIRVHLTKFLRSTMDQVRVNRALACTERILVIADLLDFEMFREGVWKREATGVINYHSQRDHTAHTLNNWLLGWYVFSKVDAIRSALEGAIVHRKWNVELFSLEEYFGHIWQFTSLLHDIGYLFEGAVSRMDTGYQSSQATIGLRAIDEYFHVEFWRQTQMTSAKDRKKLLLQADRKIPEVPADPSLSRIALYLRSLGELDTLTAAVRRQRRKGGPALPVGVLPGDAFDLWQLHFKAFGQVEAAARIKCLEQAFDADMSKGPAKLGIRVLNHGVCSGLMQLKIATYFYDLVSCIEPRAGGGAASKASSAEPSKLLEREREVAYPYNYEFWWTGIVWATASAAIHDMQQRKTWCDGVKPGPLKLEDEPLTYLGVMVDCLQDWDRYFVFHSSDRSPVQGTDVLLGIQGGRLVVQFPAEMQTKADKVREDMDQALAGWQDHVEVRPLPQPK